MAKHPQQVAERSSESKFQEPYIGSLISIRLQTNNKHHPFYQIWYTKTSVMFDTIQDSNIFKYFYKALLEGQKNLIW